MTPNPDYTADRIARSRALFEQAKRAQQRIAPADRAASRAVSQQLDALLAELEKPRAARPIASVTTRD